MKRKTHWIYFGAVIFRNTEPGSRLPFSARTSEGMRSADTLEGIKYLVRQAEGKLRKGEQG